MRNLRTQISIVAVSILLFGTGSFSDETLPEWFGEVNIFGLNSEQVDYDYVTGVLWTTNIGPWWKDTLDERGLAEVKARLAAEVERWHAQGKPYIPYIGGFLEDNLDDPSYQEVVRDAVEIMIDCGADGIMLDSGASPPFTVPIILSVKSFLEELGNDAKNYARDNYGRDFLISMNLAWTEVDVSCADELDFYTSEFFYFRWRNYYANSGIRLLQSLGDGIVALRPEVSTSSVPSQTEDLIKLIMADIYSAGGSAIVSEEVLSSETEGTQVVWSGIGIDEDNLVAYCRFILNNRDLYERLDFDPQVALIYPHSSQLQSGGFNAIDWPFYTEAAGVERGRR